MRDISNGPVVNKGKKPCLQKHLKRRDNFQENCFMEIDENFKLKAIFKKYPNLLRAME